jgi:hypothetical protein
LLPKSTQQIQGCKSVADLEQLLQVSWQDMDHVHTSATYVQLVRIQQQQQQQAAYEAGAAAGQQGLSDAAWENLQQVTLQQLHELHSRHCSNIVWACASLGRLPSEPLLQGLLARSKTLLRQGTTPQGFANTLWGLASLRVQPSADWLDSFFAASQQQLCNFQPQELSSTVWALARLQQQPPAEWCAAFFSASAAKLGSCSAQSLSNQLWGVAKLGLCVPDYWWTAATYACSIRAADLTSSGVCQVLWAAGMVAGKQQRRQQQQQKQQEQGSSASKAQWGYINPQPGFTAAAAAYDEAAAPAQPAAVQVESSSTGSTQWLQPLLAVIQPQLQQLSSTSLSSLLWALAVLQHNPGPAFVSSCLTRIAGQGTLTASNAVHALWASSSFKEAGVGQQQLRPIMLQLQQQGMQGCSPRELLYAAAALANMHHQQQEQQQQQQQQQQQFAQPSLLLPQGTVQQQQQQQVLPPLPLLPLSADGRPGLMSAGDYVNEAGGYVSLRASLAQQLLSATLQQLPRFHLGQLCQLGRWLAAAGIQPDTTWVDAFLVSTTPHLNILQQGQQLLLLHAIQHWNVQLQPGWAALFLSSCTSDLTLQRYTAGHVGALLQACAAAKLQPQPYHLKQLLQRVLQPEARLDAAAVAAVLTGLFSLGFRPPDGWVQQLWAAGAAAVLRSDAAGLSAVAIVLQHQGIWQLSLRPNRPFAAAFHAAVAAALPQMQPQQAAAVLAGLAAARMRPSGPQEHLLPSLMAATVKGLYTLPLQDVAAAWWGLVRPKVLHVAVPLELLAAGAAPGQQQQQQQLQEQLSLQQQWQALWLRKVISASSSSSGSGVAGQLCALKPAALLQLADCIRRLQQPMPATWADAYISALAVHVPRMAPHELHLLMHALPCFGAAATLPGFAHSLLAAAAPVLQDFTPSQLSDSLNSIQQAGLKPPEPWLKAYISATSAQLRQFWPRQLTKVLTALARLRFMPDAGFLSAATDAAVEHLPKYRVQPGEMVDLLWAIVALRVRPSAAWMAKFEGRLLERGPEHLDGQQLSRLGWCLSALQQKPGRLLWAKWLAATQQQMAHMDSSRYELVLKLRPGAVSLSSCLLHSCACPPTQTVCGALAWPTDLPSTPRWCFATAQPKCCSPAYFHHLGIQGAQALTAPTCHAYNVGSMRCHQLTSPSAVSSCSALLLCLPALLCCVVLCSLADTLWTCAMFDSQPSRSWLDTFSDASHKHLHSISSSTLVTVVWSLALLQHRPASDWMLDCLEVLSRSFAATLAAGHAADDEQQQQQQHALCAEPLSPAQVSKVAWAFAALDCQLPAAFSAQLLQLCLLHAPHLDADSLAQLFWAWDRLDSTQEKLYMRQLAAAARTQLMPPGFNTLMEDLIQGQYSSSSTRSSRAGASYSAGPLQRPVGRVRLGQQRVVLRPGGSSGSSGRAVVVSQQQQAAAVGAKGAQDSLSSSSGPGLPALPPQHALFAAASKGKLGTKQQLMATLQKMYASELKLQQPAGSSSSRKAADAEMSVA